VKKYWEIGEKNKFGKECYKLHFSQFYEEGDENVVLTVFVERLTRTILDSLMTLLIDISEQERLMIRM